MTRPLTGGCACGAIRYEATSEPVAEIHCQCRECQKRSGTGHSSYLAFTPRGSVRIEGEATTWRVAGDSGNVKIHAFCPTCGSPVYLDFEASPDVVAVHPGSLDDPGRFQPKAVTYAVRGHAWDMMDPSLTVFETMPPGG